MKCRVVVFALAVLAGTGCYESPVPLAPLSSAVVDARLLGHWKTVPGGNNQEGDLFVMQFNERELVACALDPGQDPEHFRAYVVDVQGTRFLNVQNIEMGGRLWERPRPEPADRPFYIVRYDIGADSLLTLRLVSSRFITQEIKTSAELRKVLGKNLQNEELYENPDRFRRAADDP